MDVGFHLGHIRDEVNTKISFNPKLLTMTPVPPSSVPVAFPGFYVSLHPHRLDEASNPILKRVTAIMFTDRTMRLPFHKSVAILCSGLTSWKMEPFPIYSPVF
jgi:hypothetical protein